MATPSITKALITKLEANPHTEALSTDTALLEKVLLQAKEAYYNTDKPLFSDESYDILEHILFEKNPGSALFKLTGAKIANPNDKTKLPYYLGSLNKVKSGEKSLTKWLKDHNGSVLISEKLDGLSTLLIIEKNKTDKHISNNYKMTLFKHGDGYEGQEITHLLKYINIGKLNYKEIDKILFEKTVETKHIALRGEIIITNDKYNDKYVKLYPKARSLVSGIVNSKNPDVNIVKDMEIVFYEYIAPNHLKYEDQFKMLETLGVNTARYNIYNSITESQLPILLIDYKKYSKYEIDGIILSDNTKPHNRVTTGYPTYAVAYKMPLDDQVANTIILNIEYNVSKHGALCPRIQYKPVVIKGDTHQYTSGFNMKYIIDSKLGPGAEVQIIKSGDVIPYIYTIIKPTTEAQMPPTDVKWHWNDTYVDAIVDNIDVNEDVNSKRIFSFFSVMKIAGVGEGIIAKFVAAGYNEVKTIIELTPDVIANIAGFQLKSATNVYDSIHKVIDKPQLLERVMMASNVFGLGLGEKKFKLITDAIPNVIDKWIKHKITKADIMTIDGFSDKSSNLFISGMPNFIIWLDIHKMIKIETVLIEDLSTKSTKLNKSNILNLLNNKFSGMVVVFTGVRNADLEHTITSNGGIIGSTISGKTTMIIAKDASESTSKLNKARDLGIKIINIDDFMSQYKI